MKILKRRAKKDSNSSGKFKILKTILIVLIIVTAAFLILWKTGTLETLKIAKQVQQQRSLVVEDDKILKELNAILELPEDAKPLMAKVTDADALREQNNDFFAKAKNGDRLIVYPDMAILYDEEANKILKVGPVNFGQGTIGTVAFALYNGTNDDNKLTEFEETLISTFNNAQVKVKDNAVGIYENTLVIDLMGDNDEINKIAESLGGQVAQLPEGETAPEGAVILIIIGQNQ